MNPGPTPQSAENDVPRDDTLSRRGIEDTLAALRKLTEAGCTVWSHQEPWAEGLRDARMREPGVLNNLPELQ